MRLALLLPLCLFLASCSKDDPVAPIVLQGGGTWATQGQRNEAAFSELDARYGYKLTFADKTGTNKIRFMFRQRPQTAEVFTAAADTSRGSNVVVHLEHNGVGYHAAGTANAAVTIDLEQGKVHLSGRNIQLLPDSTGMANSAVEFDLREY